MRLLLCGIILLATPAVHHAQQRMIIGTDVVCREGPDSAAPVVHAYRLGDRFGIRGDVDTTWFFDSWRTTRLKPNCWVYGPMTTPFTQERPATALIVMTDYVLQRAGKVRFEEYVAAENLLIGEFARALRSSGPLQYRRLLLVQKAEGARREQYALTDNAMATAWVLAHRDVLGDDPFSGAWDPLPAPYWKLYDTYKQEPWADDLAWTAAQLRSALDECYSDCILKALIVDGPLQYWIRLPAGRNIAKALELATDWAKYATGVACLDPARPVPREFQLIDQVRTSLAPVSAEGKRQLLAYLDQIETTCKKK